MCVVRAPMPVRTWCPPRAQGRAPPLLLGSPLTDFSPSCLPGPPPPPRLSLQEVGGATIPPPPPSCDSQPLTPGRDPSTAPLEPAGLAFGGKRPLLDGGGEFPLLMLISNPPLHSKCHGSGRSRLLQSCLTGQAAGLGRGLRWTEAGGPEAVGSQLLQVQWSEHWAPQPWRGAEQAVSPTQGRTPSHAH